MNKNQEMNENFQVWWVNHGQMYAKAKKEGYLWAPSPVKGGKTFDHWESMRKVLPGDLLINFAQNKIVSISIAKNKAKKYLNRKKEGWQVEIDFHDLLDAIEFDEIQSYMDTINESIATNKPFNLLTQGVNQGYLFNFSSSGLHAIAERYIDKIPKKIKNLLGITSEMNFSKFLNNKGFFFEADIITRFVLSLKTKPFVILTGKPGTGKTKLAQLYALYQDETNQKAFSSSDGDKLLNRRWFKLSYNDKNVVESFKSTGEKIDQLRHTILKDGLMSLGWLDRKENKELNQKKMMKELQPGDVIIAYEGGFTIGGIGVVTQAHFFDDVGDAHDSFNESTKNFIRIDWKFCGPLKIKDFYLEEYRIPAFGMWGDSIYQLNKSQLDGFSDYLVKKGILLTDKGVHNISRTYELISVGSNWNDKNSFLGSFNIETQEYHKTKILELILNAGKAIEIGLDIPFFLILDEMNLSCVEYYFANFLSALESGEQIELHNSESVEQFMDIPKEMALPSNLFIVGTINNDKTTHPISPKVLDRANLIELSGIAARNYLNHSQQRTLLNKDFSFTGTNPAHTLTPGAIFKIMKEVQVNSEQTPDFSKKIVYEIESFQNILNHTGFEFGFRVINEIIKYMYIAWDKDGRPDIWNGWTDAFDAQILQKILPKIKGNEKEIQTTIKCLYCLCFYGINDEHLIELSEGRVIDELFGMEYREAHYQGAAKKLHFMQKKLDSQGYVSFF